MAGGWRGPGRPQALGTQGWGRTCAGSSQMARSGPHPSQPRPLLRVPELTTSLGKPAVATRLWAWQLVVAPTSSWMLPTGGVQGGQERGTGRSETLASTALTPQTHSGLVANRSVLGKLRGPRGRRDCAGEAGGDHWAGPAAPWHRRVPLGPPKPMWLCPPFRLGCFPLAFT